VLTSPASAHLEKTIKSISVIGASTGQIPLPQPIEGNQVFFKFPRFTFGRKIYKQI
jgi:hypothetical protein